MAKTLGSLMTVGSDDHCQKNKPHDVKPTSGYSILDSW